MSLLMDEHWLTVNPWLAEKIGLHEALFLQQLRFWIQREMGFEDDQGRRWIYNSIASWMKQFPFIHSERTFKRMLSKLQESGLLLTTTAFNKSNLDRTLAYTIDEVRLEKLDGEYQEERQARKQNRLKGQRESSSRVSEVPHRDLPHRECQNDPIDSAKFTPSRVPNLPHRECQNGTIESEGVSLDNTGLQALSSRACVTTQTNNTSYNNTTTKQSTTVVSPVLDVDLKKVYAQCETFGVERSAAKMLVEKYGTGEVCEKMEMLRNARKSQTIQNEAGWLFSALKHKYAPPKSQEKHRKKTEEIQKSVSALKAQIALEEEELKQVEISPASPFYAIYQKGREAHEPDWERP